MKAKQFVGTLVLLAISTSRIDAQSRATSVEDIQATLKTLQPASQAVLRVRRDARKIDSGEHYREQIRELRKFIGRLERESIDQGQVISDQNMTKTSGPTARVRAPKSRPEIRQRLRSRMEALKSSMAARQGKVNAPGRDIGSGLPQKAITRLLEDIHSELEKPGRLDLAKLRKLKENTRLVPGLVDEKEGDEMPTISTIIKHRRDF